MQHCITLLWSGLKKPNSMCEHSFRGLKHPSQFRYRHIYNRPAQRFSQLVCWWSYCRSRMFPFGSLTISSLCGLFSVLQCWLCVCIGCTLYWCFHFQLQTFLYGQTNRWKQTGWKHFWWCRNKESYSGVSLPHLTATLSLKSAQWLNSAQRDTVTRALWGSKLEKLGNKSCIIHERARRGAERETWHLCVWER